MHAKRKKNRVTSEIEIIKYSTLKQEPYHERLQKANICLEGPSNASMENISSIMFWNPYNDQ